MFLNGQVILYAPCPAGEVCMGVGVGVGRLVVTDLYILTGNILP